MALMERPVAQSFDGYDLFKDVPFAKAPLGGDDITLHSSIYMPRDCAVPPPLFVWFHQGAFKFGNQNTKISQRVGRRLSKQGIAVASVQYRLHCTNDDLSPTVRQNMDRFQQKQARLIRPGLCQSRSLGALEDGVRFLDWADRMASSFGWSSARVVGGSSAGGITACNIAFAAEDLGLGTPRIEGVCALSGGFNYPDLVTPRKGLRVLALHNPDDKKVSIKGVRMLKAKLGDSMELLESDDFIHGHCELHPDERPFLTYARLAKFVAPALFDR